VFLGGPNLKASVVEPKRSPIIGAHAHRHPLGSRDDRSAGIAGLSDTLPMPELDEVISWQSAVMDPLPNYFLKEGRFHAQEQHHIIGFPDGIESFPISGIG